MYSQSHNIYGMGTTPQLNLQAQSRLRSPGYGERCNRQSLVLYATF